MKISVAGQFIDKPFIIYGAGGHARVVFDAARLSGLLPNLIVDDAPSESTLFGVPILPSSNQQWLGLKCFNYIVAIGNNIVRQSVYSKLLERGGTPCSVIHPKAIISDFAQIGYGTVCMAGVVVNPGATIGHNSILNTGCSVDHDCQIGDHVHLGPGTSLAGSVKIGDLTMIGTGSAIIPGVQIGSKVVVGGGSAVIRDLPNNAVAFGNPARQRLIRELHLSN